MYVDEFQAKRDQEEEMRLRSVWENQLTEIAVSLILWLLGIAAVCAFAWKVAG